MIGFVERFLQDLNIETKRNRKGGLIATIKGTDDKEHRMLTAHVDTLGAMVKEIKSNGRLRLALIGGFQYNSIEGEYCEIETASGHTYTGTILCIKHPFMFMRMLEKRNETKKIWRFVSMKR
ncbi:hypothetical protein BsIDN1_18900 [Bacillus safensis]|uniref:Uncharacterized protein n=1 Tax=Bacillus safensis TaxID=561879 RepID=A0A5S9M6L5_BACIA|nr:hypothetical protein BsIDN1_18900 [Bacillus safensis]